MSLLGVLAVLDRGPVEQYVGERLIDDGPRQHDPPAMDIVIGQESQRCRVEIYGLGVGVLDLACSAACAANSTALSRSLACPAAQ
jgi:hypothetical protein